MTPNPLRVTLNGKPYELTARDGELPTLADLLDLAGLAPESVATAVNGRFVPRGQRGSCALAEGDSVTGFQPIVGG